MTGKKASFLRGGKEGKERDQEVGGVKGRVVLLMGEAFCQVPRIKFHITLRFAGIKKGRKRGGTGEKKSQHRISSRARKGPFYPGSWQHVQKKRSSKALKKTKNPFQDKNLHPPAPESKEGSFGGPGVHAPTQALKKKNARGSKRGEKRAGGERKGYLKSKCHLRAKGGCMQDDQKEKEIHLHEKGRKKKQEEKLGKVPTREDRILLANDQQITTTPVRGSRNFKGEKNKS